MAKIKLNKEENIYWSNVSISAAQVFLGIFAAILFVGELDFYKAYVLLINIGLVFAFLIFGWRMIK